jgi:hypothetical protein
MFIESIIPEELNGQKLIVIGPKGDRDRFTDWIQVSISINRQVQVVGIDLPKMVPMQAFSDLVDIHLLDS